MYCIGWLFFGGGEDKGQPSLYAFDIKKECGKNNKTGDKVRKGIYNFYILKYTLVPLFKDLLWQFNFLLKKRFQRKPNNKK